MKTLLNTVFLTLTTIYIACAITTYINGLYIHSSIMLIATLYGIAIILYANNIKLYKIRYFIFEVRRSFKRIKGVQ